MLHMYYTMYTFKKNIQDYFMYNKMGFSPSTAQRVSCIGGVLHFHSASCLLCKYHIDMLPCDIIQTASYLHIYQLNIPSPIGLF